MATLRVTDLNYPMEDLLIDKLDLMIKRMTGKNQNDNVLLVEGGEGDGKTNMSCCVGYYIAEKTGRHFSNDSFYYQLNELVAAAKTSSEKIFVWDEPALDGLSDEWWKEAQKNLIKLLMMARKKKHFFIINITKFFKFPEYVVVDRSIGMIHVYSKGELTPGYFVYFKKKSKEQLYYSYKSRRRREYKKFYNFRGTFPWMLPKIIDEAEYERKKDEAIASIGEREKVGKDKKKLLTLQYQISLLPLDKEKIAECFNISTRTIHRWKNIASKYKISLEKDENDL
jgi:hypothetical protein|tara:strand:+ start:10726 stop:11574 length:849 start_codon:yes stop_codon:yes gene_type:complete